MRTKAEIFSACKRNCNEVNLRSKMFFCCRLEGRSDFIVQDISSVLGEKVIVTVALAEDNPIYDAGAFESILDVTQPQQRPRKPTIGLVMSSCSNRDAKDQVLVQPMLKASKAGVIYNTSKRCSCLCY